MKVPPMVANRLDKLVSTKLGISGGAIAALTQLGMDPNWAGVCITIIAVAFVVVAGLGDYKRGGVKAVLEGMKAYLPEATPPK